MRKQCKRIICAVLACLLLAGAVPYSAADTAAFTFTATPSVATVPGGGSFTVSVIVTGGDFAAAQATLKYDKNKLEFQNGSQRGPASLRINADTEGEVFVAVYGETLGSGAAIATLTFKAEEDAGGTGFSIENMIVGVAGQISDVPGTDGTTETVTVTRPLTGVKIAVSGTYTYTGSEIVPDNSSVSVTLSDVPLVLDQDFEIIGCTSNVNVGVATITIGGIGNYTGTAHGTFTISPKPLTMDMIGTIPTMTYTGGAREPIIAVKDGEKTLTRNTDYTVAYSNNINAKESGGTNPPTVTVTGKGNYSGEAGKEFTINKAEMTGVTVKGFSGEFDGNPHSIEVTGFPAGSIDEYSEDDVHYSRTNPTYTATTESVKTVYYRVTHDNYETISGSADVMIYPKGNIEGIEARGYSGVYNGTARGATVKVPEGAKVWFKDTDGTYKEIPSPTRTNVGTLQVSYMVTLDDHTPVYGSVIITITPAAMNVTARDYTGVYDEKAHTITVNKPSGGDFVVQYSADGVTYDEPEIKHTNVGTYSVYYKVTEKNNNYTPVIGKAFVTITRQTQTGITATGVNKVYDGKDASITMNGAADATVTYSEDKNGPFYPNNPTYRNEGAHTVYYKAERANYETVTGSATVNIRAAAMTVTAADVSVKHDGEKHHITVNVVQPAAGYTVTYSDDGQTYDGNIREKTDAGTSTVYYKVTAPNYIDFTGSATITITQSDINGVSATGKSVTYDKTPYSIAVDKGDGETITYSETANGTYTPTNPEKTNAGTYTVYYRVSAGGNKIPFDGSAVIAIQKAERELKNVTIDKPTLVGDATGTINYECSNLDASAASAVRFISSNPVVVSVNNAGKVTIHGNGTAKISVILLETANYKADAVYDAVTVTAIQRPITSVRSVAATDASSIVSGYLDGRNIYVSGAVKADDPITVTYVKHDGNTGTFEIGQSGGEFTITGTEITSGGNGFKLNPDNLGNADYSIDTSKLTVLAVNVGADLNLHDAGANVGVDDDFEDDTGVVQAAMENAAINNLSAAAAAELLKEIEETAKDKVSGYVTDNDLKTDVPGESGEADKVTLTVRVYADINAKKYETDAITQKKRFRVDINPRYDVILSTNGNANDLPIQSGPLENKKITAPVEIVIPLPSDFDLDDDRDTVRVTHFGSDNKTRYIAANVRRTGAGIFVVFQTSSFSEFEIEDDSRAVTVSYTFEDGRQQEITYTAAKDFGNPLETDSRGEDIFDGWVISKNGEVKITTKTVTDALLNLGGELTAVAKFTAKQPDQPGPTGPTGPSGPTGGGGGGGAAETPETSVNEGIVNIEPELTKNTQTGAVSATISEDSIKSAFEGGTIAGVTINIPASESVNAETPVEATVTKDAFAMIAGNKAALAIESPALNITFDANAVNTIAGAGNGDVVIAAGLADTAALTEEQRASAGDRPVYSFTVTNGGNPVSNLGGSAAISLPYTPKPGEDPNAIIICYIDAEGRLQTIPGGVYDTAAGRINFAVTHFSLYMIGYNPIAFADVSGHWASGYITFTAARGLFSGVGNDMFSPNTSMTRAMFAAVLARADRADTSAYGSSRFTDVPTDAWYSGAVEWVAEKGIVMGVGDNRFDPDAQITREQMAVMLGRYISFKNTSLPSAGSSGAFNDDAQISTWAKASVTTIKNAGIITGKPGDIFDPQGTATRAEVTAVFTRLIEALIK